MARRSPTRTSGPADSPAAEDTAAAPRPRGGRASSSGRSPNGSGSVVARRRAHDTVYDVFWSYDDDEGVRRRGSARGFATAKEAENHRRSVTATVDSGRYVAPADMTVGEHLVEWIDGQRLKLATTAGYRRKIRLHITPNIGRVPLDQLRPLHLNELYRHLETQGRTGGGALSMSTVREVHNILSSACSDVVKAGLLPLSPTRRADPPTERECKARRPEMSVWSASQLRTFLQRDRGDHHYPIWHVLAATGLRRGEVLGLRWADIDLAHGVVSVRRSLGYADTPPGQPEQLVFGPVKNHGAHVIHVDAETVRVLQEHRAAQEADRLALGERWVDQDLLRVWVWPQPGEGPDSAALLYGVPAPQVTDVPSPRFQATRSTCAVAVTVMPPAVASGTMPMVVAVSPRMEMARWASYAGSGPVGGVADQEEWRAGADLREKVCETLPAVSTGVRAGQGLGEAASTTPLG